jgi:hypothetical protein
LLKVWQKKPFKISLTFTAYLTIPIVQSIAPSDRTLIPKCDRFLVSGMGNLSVDYEVRLFTVNELMQETQLPFVYSPNLPQLSPPRLLKVQ